VGKYPGLLISALRFFSVKMELGDNGQAERAAAARAQAVVFAPQPSIIRDGFFLPMTTTSRFSSKPAELSLRHPWVVIAVFAALTLAALGGLPRLELRMDGHALVSADDPTTRLDAEVREHFHLRDPLVVLIETTDPRGIYSPQVLRSVQELSRIFAGLPGIGPENVASLATEHRHRVYPGTLRFRPFLDPLPDTPELVALLDGDLRAAGILDGTLVSADRKAVTILVGVPPVDRAHPYNRTAFYNQVAAAARPFASDTVSIDVVGAPAAESLLGDYILQDLRLLLPLSIAVIGLIVWLGTRRLAGLGIAYLKITICLIWTFGLMGWVGSPIYLTTAILPVILVIVGFAYEIHILWHYQGVLERPGRLASPHPEALRETMGEMMRPVVFSSLTTAFGFFSFMTSSLEPVRAFGLFAGLGVLFCLLGSVSLVPAILRLLPPAALRHPGRSGGGAGHTLRHLLGPLLRRPRLSLTVLLLVTLGLGAGASRLYVQDSWIEGFAPGSPFRQATERVNAKLFGTHILLAHVRFDLPPERTPEVFDRRGALFDPALLAALGQFENDVRRLPGVGGVLGPAGQMAAVHALWMGQESARVLPATPQRADQLLRMFDLGRGAQRRREVIDDDYRRVVVTIFLKDANFRDTARLMRSVRELAARRLGPFQARLDFAGDVAVSQAMIPAIVNTQVSSTLGSLLGCLTALLLLHRSVRLGLIAVLPTLLSTLWVFGLMGWLAIPLGIATSMFCAINLGIGDDYAIHFVDRYRAALASGQSSPVLHAIQESGPAILNDTLAIALGFGLLAFSRVPANAVLGILVALALVAGCLLTLVGLGSLLQTGLGSRLLGPLAPPRRPLGNGAES
jgi:predicted RND superfamily exporter protein